MAISIAQSTNGAVREPLLLCVFLIRCDAFCHVGLDVVVVIHIVVGMAAIRSEELSGNLGDILGHRISFGVRHDHAASEVNLCVSTDIPDLRLAGFLIQHDWPMFRLAGA